MTLRVGGGTLPLLNPNLRAEEFRLIKPYQPVSLKAKSAENHDSENTAMAHEKKTFHMIENFQNVLDIDISYEKRVPPIGAPKAAATPAEHPAAIKWRLLLSFLM